VIPKLPRAAGHGALKKAWEKAEVNEKWSQSAWAKKIVQREKRSQLTDFDRFKVLRLRKQVSAVLLHFSPPKLQPQERKLYCWDITGSTIADSITRPVLRFGNRLLRFVLLERRDGKEVAVPE
jgi:hypothetical protein